MTAQKKTVAKKAPVRRSRVKKPVEAKTEVTLAEALAESGEKMEDLAEKPSDSKGQSKSAIAQVIFDEEWKKTGGKPIRKDVIARFIAEANLTKAGSSTYFFNIRKKYI